MITTPKVYEDRWAVLQNRRTRLTRKRNFFGLLAALDAGWHIEHPRTPARDGVSARGDAHVSLYPAAWAIYDNDQRGRHSPSARVLDEQRITINELTWPVCRVMTPKLKLFLTNHKRDFNIPW